MVISAYPKHIYYVHIFCYTYTKEKKLTYYDPASFCFSQKRFLIFAQTFILFVCLQNLLDTLLRRRLIIGLQFLFQCIYMITRRVRHLYIQARRKKYICKQTCMDEARRNAFYHAIKNFLTAENPRIWQAVPNFTEDSRTEKRTRTVYIGGIFLERSKRSIGQPRVMTETNERSFNRSCSHLHSRHLE